ncbi:hypothetical protein ACWGII_30740 [Streptomyces sp. NPDC054855]
MAAVAEEVRCTPMQVGTSALSTAATTSIPPESKLASGVSESTTAKKSKAKAGGRRKLNTVGRRFQLARELTLDWLRGCLVPQIAWVARNVADAGWTVTDVRGWLHLRGEAARVRRGSGLLAVLLAGAEQVLDTPAKRAHAVEQWRGAQEAARRDRIEQVRIRREHSEDVWGAPPSLAVQRRAEDAFAQVRGIASSRLHDGRTQVELSALEVSEQELRELRAAAAGELMCGEATLIISLEPDMAVRVFGERLVRRAQQLTSGARSSLMSIGC